jgi:hypothetical protein
MVAIMEEQKTAGLQVEYGAEGTLRLTALNLLLVGSLVISSIILYILYHRVPAPKYFAINHENQFFTLPPSSEPSLSLGLLQNWVTTFALDAHTFDFQNFDEQIFEMKKYFTDDGYKEYLVSMAPLSERIKADQLLLSCFVTEAPAIQRSTTINNYYEWYVQVPIMIRYDSSSTSKNERRTLSLVIKRADTMSNPYGVAVSIFNSTI